jgi:hypothetical protein
MTSRLQMSHSCQRRKNRQLISWPERRTAEMTCRETGSIVVLLFAEALWGSGHSAKPRSIAPLGCGEMLERALYSIASAIALHRVDCVVEGHPRGKALDAHAKNRLGVVSV